MLSIEDSVNFDSRARGLDQYLSNVVDSTLELHEFYSHFVHCMHEQAHAL